MTEEIEFPDVNQGSLDEATLAQYFRDLEHAEVFAVMVKGGPERYANARSLELSTGKQLFEEGRAGSLPVAGRGVVGYALSHARRNPPGAYPARLARRIAARRIAARRIANRSQRTIRNPYVLHCLCSRRFSNQGKQ